MNFYTKVALFVFAAFALTAVTQGQDCPCNNSPPPLGPRGLAFSCEEQKQFGKCSAGFMQGYCECTCGTCDVMMEDMMYITPMMEM